MIKVLFLQKCFGLSDPMAEGPTIGIGHVKGQLNDALEQSMEQVAKDEVTLLGLGVGSDSQEAMLSFVEKREPHFTGR